MTTETPTLRQRIDAATTPAERQPIINEIVVTAPELAEALDDAARAPARLAAAPCPFCGCRPTVGPRGWPPVPGVWCPGHECQGISMDGKTSADAIALWNRRAPRESL